MIDYYDQLQESVKMREAVIRGKAKSTHKLSSLSMRVILQKNKEIKHVKKQHLSRVIEARKLRIKVSEVLNIKNPSLIQFAVSAQLSKRNSVIKKPEELIIKTAKMHTSSNKLLTTNVFMSERKPKRNSFRLFSQESNIQEDGRINLFDNFTQEQLDRIQENQAYYLIKPDLIPIFRKFMHRKRQNNKDFSYDNFTIKPKQAILRQQQDPNFDKKSYILKKLKISERKKTIDNELHLLTNPIQFTTMSQKPRSKSQFQLRQSKKSMINMLKGKQAQNKQRLIAEQNKKILGLRINRNYFDGLAAEKRAMHRDKLHELLANKNKLHDDKSITCRKRIKTLKEDMGKSVEMAEIVRLELLKRRTAHRKKG